MSFDTPILLIVFNRPEKTRRLFEIIKKIKPKKLFVSADGPREKQSDVVNCKNVRKIFDDIELECDVVKKFNIKNEGLKKNVKDSIDWFFSNVEKGIILEDDCLPSEDFFLFCGELLKMYETDERIMQINGTNLGIDFSTKISKSYFLSKLCHVWGWASWKRAWNKFDTELKDFEKLKNNKFLLKYYEDKKIYNWMMKYYDKLISREDNIWSTIWSYAIAKNNGFCITPTKNLVRNIGFDGSGTSGKSNIFNEFSKTQIYKINKIKHPSKLEYDFNFDKVCFYEKIYKIDPRASKINMFKYFFKKVFK